MSSTLWRRRGSPPPCASRSFSSPLTSCVRLPDPLPPLRARALAVRSLSGYAGTHDALTRCGVRCSPTAELSTFSITLPGQLAIVNGLGLRDLFDGNGFSLYSTFFWLFVVLIAVSIAICVFVGRCFLENHFPVVWPVRFLRSVLRCDLASALRLCGRIAHRAPASPGRA